MDDRPVGDARGRKYALVSDGQATEMFPNVMKAGWPGQVVQVHVDDTGPYTADQHLFAMIGGNGGSSPGRSHGLLQRQPGERVARLQARHRRAAVGRGASGPEGRDLDLKLSGLRSLRHAEVEVGR